MLILLTGLLITSAPGMVSALFSTMFNTMFSDLSRSESSGLFTGQSNGQSTGQHPLKVIKGGNLLMAQSSNPTGNLQPAPKEKIWAQTLSGNYFNEFWNYQFYFSNGIKVHLIFSAVNFGSLKAPVTGARVSVLFPDGELHQISREYDLGNLIQEKNSRRARFQLQENRDLYFEGTLPEEHTIVFKTTKNGVRYDIHLSLQEISRGLQWDDGKFELNGSTIGLVTHIPYAKVSGHVAVNERFSEVEGTAYMDHTYQYRTTIQLMDSGKRFIWHQDPDNWIVIYCLTPRGGTTGKLQKQAIGYMLRKQNGENVEIKGIERVKMTTRSRAFGVYLPSVMDLQMEDGETIRVVRTEDEEKFSILGELNWIARSAAKSYLGGEVIDVRGSASLLQEGEKPLMGDYNYFVVDR